MTEIPNKSSGIVAEVILTERLIDLELSIGPRFSWWCHVNAVVGKSRGASTFSDY